MLLPRCRHRRLPLSSNIHITINPIKLQKMRKEIDYILQNHIIEQNDSDESSPSILVSKPDGTLRFCMNFCKLNTLIKTDSFPLLQIEDTGLTELEGQNM